MTPLYSIQINGEEEEMFDLVDIFDHRAHAVIHSKSVNEFKIKDYVISEQWPTTVLFKRNAGGFFDISIEKEGG